MPKKTLPISNLRNVNISIRVTETVRQAAVKAAIADRRSTASLAEKLLVQYLEQHGYLSGDNTTPSTAAKKPPAASAPKARPRAGKGV
jgi:hypothetical protein